jgi:hypothetical protein
MLTAAQWISGTWLSGAIREIDWVVPLLQTLHILAIAVVLSSVLMIELRALQITTSQTLAEAGRRHEGWIWAGLAILAVTGAPLIVAEPQRTLPNVSFQIKLVLLVFAALTTFRLCRLLRHGAASDKDSSFLARILAVAAFLFWCGAAVAGRFIAYTQPN